MKKVFFCLIFIILLLGAPPCFAQEAQIATLSAEVKDLRVTIKGSVNIPQSRQITLKVIDPQGKLNHLNQFGCQNDGTFQYSYKLTSPSQGAYQVFAGGTGIRTLKTTTMSYSADSGDSGGDGGGGGGDEQGGTQTGIIKGVTITPLSHVAGLAQEITVTVTTENILDGTVVKAELVTAQGDSLIPAVTAVDAVVLNSTIIRLTIPDTVAEGEYKIKVTADDAVNTQSAYTISAPVDECFIATAAYGTKYDPAVVMLRQFRDQWLLTNEAGKAFVQYYYQNSPPIARFIANQEGLKTLIRFALIPAIAVAYALMHPWVVVAVSLLVASIYVYYRRSKSTISVG
ncbi:CFI-box-CTERM domain-containing protein [Heliophilum fasciatum]|uniref:Ig-like domain-containing protein n=1 Tax=Heliophilum fasciatum TaxID=35700 RepID=A0A4R2RN15_9FIRM|nr:CFI-box-CTERM domain-containing protein [Heliophilum fasciatum]MCW2277867.1 hypothetical protein [Heliophilum fasciatum]TCP64563.1 hypothetical protein EDD73_109105 [Heliophilum fasciatum]